MGNSSHHVPLHRGQREEGSRTRAYGAHRRLQAVLADQATPRPRSAHRLTPADTWCAPTDAVPAVLDAHREGTGSRSLTAPGRRRQSGPQRSRPSGPVRSPASRRTDRVPTDLTQRPSVAHASGEFVELAGSGEDRVRVRLRSTGARPSSIEAAMLASRGSCTDVYARRILGWKTSIAPP